MLFEKKIIPYLHVCKLLLNPFLSPFFVGHKLLLTMLDIPVVVGVRKLILNFEQAFLFFPI